MRRKSKENAKKVKKMVRKSRKNGKKVDHVERGFLVDEGPLGTFLGRAKELLCKIRCNQDFGLNRGDVLSALLPCLLGELFMQRT